MLLCWIVATNPAELSGDCRTVQPGHRPDRCFNHTRLVKANSQQLPEVSCERKDWWQIIEAVRSHLGVPNYSIIDCLKEYGICRRSIVTLESLEIYKLWQLTGGLNVKTPAEYYALPALWTEIVQVFDAEMKKVNDGH